MNGNDLVPVFVDIEAQLYAAGRKGFRFNPDGCVRLAAFSQQLFQDPFRMNYFPVLKLDVRNKSYLVFPIGIEDLGFGKSLQQIQDL